MQIVDWYGTDAMVDEHGGVEVILLVEQTVSNVTFVWFLTVVSPDMSLEIVKLNYFPQLNGFGGERIPSHLETSASRRNI